jgi:cell division protein FtsW (lipid II flippase)
MLIPLTMGYIGILAIQFSLIKHKNTERAYDYHRLQTVIILFFHLVAYTILLYHYDFEYKVIMIYLGQIGLILLSGHIVNLYMNKTILPLWSIGQFLLVISFILLGRLSINLGLKQFYLSCLAYVIVFIVAFLYSRMNYIKYLGVPSVILAVVMLVMTNETINGATNWMRIGSFTFQPSEVVKILYIVFLASTLTQFHEHEKLSLFVTGTITMGMVIIQVYQRDLGSALIFYSVFILMSYVYTRNRLYIIGGTIMTMLGGFFAYRFFWHVRVRIDTWIDPFSDIDNTGYQITQSLFAIGNGGLFGRGLTLGLPNRIPVVTTDFIYSAIVEELGLVIGLGIIIMIVYFFLFGIQMIEKSQNDFNFLTGSGILIIIAVQSFLIIGGVTKAIPLTGVTLPFVSYGGSSLVSTFIMLGILQGIKMNEDRHYKKEMLRKKEKLIEQMLLEEENCEA